MLETTGVTLDQRIESVRHTVQCCAVLLFERVSSTASSILLIFIAYSFSPCNFCVTGGLQMRRDIARTLWPYMLSIGLAYFVTLCLFPGIESEVVSCALRGWMPVILMAIFNATDFCGKVGHCTMQNLSYY